jgi:glycosyltransferase involved in cell wall biosynthesis
VKILTHNIHSGYDAELAKTGHEFYATDGFKPWDPSIRAVPPNWHLIEKPDGMEFDLILVSHAWDLADKFHDIPAPMIFNIIADCSEGILPEKLEKRVSTVAFLAKEVAARWLMKDPSKKRVIEMGIDSSPFLEHTGELPGVVTVGHRIGQRWDKGHCPYVTTAQFIPLTLIGPGNEGLPGAVGTLSHSALMEAYAKNRVYFNPGPIVGISMAEAMTAGMPVVSFRPINLSDLVVDGVNGFVVDTVDGAVLKIRSLLEDPGRAFEMGKEARKTALERFGLEKFRNAWNRLFEEVGAPVKPSPCPEDGNTPAKAAPAESPSS